MYFARHAQAAHNLRPGVFDGVDSEITATGVDQSYQVGAFIAAHNADIKLVATSDRRRTIGTWQAASTQVHGSLPVCYVSKAFGEISWGEWANMPRAEVLTEDVEEEAALFGRDFRPPGGQTITEKATEMRRGLARAEKVDLLVSHGFAIKSLIGDSLGWTRQEICDFPLDPGEIISFDPASPEPPVRVFKPSSSPLGAVSPF